MNKQLVIMVVFMFYSITTFTQKTDFSGVWIMNRDKSEFGKVPITTASPKLTVVQKKDAITITRIADTTSWFATMKFDGSVTETLRPDNTKRSATLQWMDNNHTLIETAIMIREISTDNESKKTTHTWKLSADGKTLTIVSIFEFPNHDPFTINVVYEKQ